MASSLRRCGLGWNRRIGSKHRRVGQTRAFTLVELLVVIAIIGVLVALLLPAIQAAREAARRSQCSNNLRQLAVAAHNYHDTHNSLPGGAYCRRGTINRCHVWIESLFPFIEQQAIYDEIDFNVNIDSGPNRNLLLRGLKIGSLMCPSDPDAGLFPNRREEGYLSSGGESLGQSYGPSGGPFRCNFGEGLYPCKSERADCRDNYGLSTRPVSPGMFAMGCTAYGFGDAIDGLSNTFLFGERLPIQNSFVMYFVSHGASLGSTRIPPNYFKMFPDCDLNTGYDSRGPSGSGCNSGLQGGGFNSRHPGGLHMALADGSVRFINETIDYVTWNALGDKESGMTIGSY